MTLSHSPGTTHNLALNPEMGYGNLVERSASDKESVAIETEKSRGHIRDVAEAIKLQILFAAKDKGWLDQMKKALQPLLDGQKITLVEERGKIIVIIMTPEIYKDPVLADTLYKLSRDLRISGIDTDVRIVGLLAEECEIVAVRDILTPTIFPKDHIPMQGRSVADKEKQWDAFATSLGNLVEQLRPREE